MADPVAIAIKHEATTREFVETLQTINERLDRIEAVLNPANPAEFSEVLMAGPDVAAIVKAAKEEILAAFVAKAPSNTGPVAVAVADPEPAAKPKGK